MPSERVQRRIDRLLDQAEEAVAALNWGQVSETAGSVLSVDPNNEDAKSFITMAQHNLGSKPRIGDAPAVDDSEPYSQTQPKSFASGRYNVSKFLGEGGKKKVYLAHDNTLDRDVAFALIKTEGLDAISRERVTREAQAMGRMGTHPCIMPIYDLGEEPDANGVAQPFMVQPLMGGGDVEGLIEDAEGPLPLEDAIRIATQTAQGLVFAHGKGIVHRDLKPGNVWMDEDGAAKIGDFGLAVATDRSRLTVEKMMVGTVNYMPPEQATGGEVTPKADLYSLGAMLYEMSTGRVPFMGDDDIAVISQHVNTPPVAPSWHNALIPKTLDSLILRMMAKDPAERPADAAEVLTALNAVDLSAVEERDESGKGSLDAMAGGVFVGRHREMDQLKAGFEEMLSGKGRMVTLVGEPGIGKTRTAQELATYAAMRGAEVLWGRSYESGGAPPYWPWVQAIRSHVAATDSQVLRSQLGSTGPVIAEIVSDVKEKLPDISAPVPIEDPESARFRLFDSISTFLKNTASTTPLVLMLEDLHWSDKPSLMLLEFVARELANSRILIVGNYRDMELNRRHPLSVTLGDLSRERLFERVVLRGLQRHDVERFIEIAAGISPPPALVDTVHSQTEGNPLFVTETVRLLIQEGDITSGQSTSGGTTSWEIRIPEGVREVIGRRLDRLSERTNEVLTIAAVIGRQFRFPVLKMLMEDTTDGQLLDALDEALSARIIEELPTEIGLHQFTHAQMQETLTEELSANRRVRMHARIAEALEEHYGDQAEEHAAELVEHFAEAETVLGRDRIVVYASLAGDQALSTYGFEEAAAHFRTGLDALDNNVSLLRRAHLHRGLARALTQTLARHELQAAVDQMVLAFDAFVEASEIDAAVEIALTHFPPVHGPVGLSDVIGRAAELVEPGSLTHGLLLGSLVRWIGYEYDGDPARTAKVFAEAISIANELRNDRLKLWVLVHSVAVEIANITHDQSWERTVEAIRLSEELEDDNSEYVVKEVAADVMLGRGQYQEALSLATGALAAARRSRNRFNISTALSVLAGVKLAVGDWDAADELLDEGLSMSPDETRLLMYKVMSLAERGIFDQANELVDRGNALGRIPNVWMATVLWTLHPATLVSQLSGTDVIDRTVLDKAIELAESSSSARAVHGARVQLAAVALFLKDPDLLRIALVEYQIPQRIMRRGSMRCPHQVFASALHLVGRVDEAVEAFDQGLNFCHRLGDRPGVVWLNADYSELLLERNAPGDHEKAIELQDEAISIATELGMKPLLERVLAKREILKA